MFPSLPLKRLGAAAAATLLLIMTGCSAPSLQQGGSSGATPPAASEPEKPSVPTYASFPYFTDKRVTEKDRKLILSNDESNRFALVYTLSLGSKVLYQSEKIRPGESEAWDILDACGRTCTLEIKITAWSLEDDTEQNTVTQTIDLTIPEQKADPDDAGDI